MNETTVVQDETDRLDVVEESLAYDIMLLQMDVY